MILKKEYANTLIKVLEDDLKDMSTIKEPSNATQQCIAWSNEMLTKFRSGDMDIDEALVGYLDTIIFNYMPPTKEIYQDLVNIMVFIVKNTKDVVYPIKSVDELVQIFTWAKDEGRGLKIHKIHKLYDGSLTNPDIDIIHTSNLDRTIEFYKGIYTNTVMSYSVF